jgi:hypothetical protein
MAAQIRPRAGFGTTQKNIPGVIARSKAMYNGFTNNVALLGSPTITMVVFLALINALIAAQETATQTKAKGSAAIRDTKRDAVWTAMETLQKYAQGMADVLTVDAAIALISAAGLVVMKVARRQKAALTAALTPGQGNVLLQANRTLLAGAANAGKRVSFNWQWSGDGGKTWNSVATTPVASTEIPGLTPMTTYSFRVSVTIGKQAPGPWSQAVTLLVH